MAYPEEWSALSKSEDLAITWEPGIADTVRLVISGNFVSDAVFEDAVDLVIPNMGSYTVTSEQLAPYAVGPIQVTVSRSTHRLVRVGEKQVVLLEVISQRSVSARLEE